MRDNILSNVPIFPLHRASVPSSLATRTKQFTIPRILNWGFIKYYGFYQPVYGTWPLLAMWWEAAWFWRRSFTLSIGATQVLLKNDMSNWYESSSKSHYLIPPETPPSMKLTIMLSFAFGAILYLCFIWKKFFNKIWINSQFWVTKWSKCALI